ncbi:MAG: hypothetical protein IKM19_07615 [Firmicutes bacterium]|nr:hypothetical protein [Bacillota bacterium]MBR3706823.1 hypothetical protein [Bacillota bacterium]
MTKVKRLVKIREIPIEDIDGFPDHPYKVRDDEEMAALVESIRDNGHRPAVEISYLLRDLQEALLTVWRWRLVNLIMLRRFV